MPLLLRHFKLSEFDSPDAPGSGSNMNPAFLTVLDDIREECKFAFQISSGFRTPGHNAAVDGKPNSEHLRGEAVDIAATSLQKFLIVRIALKHGIRRIGIGANFVHLGFSYSLPQDVLWTY